MATTEEGGVIYVLLPIDFLEKIFCSIYEVIGGTEVARAQPINNLTKKIRSREFIHDPHKNIFMAKVTQQELNSIQETYDNLRNYIF